MNCVFGNPYEDLDALCYEDPRWNMVMFDSIVALDLDTGRMKWFERLAGYRTWNMTCGSDGYISPTTAKCDAFDDTCPFKKNRFANCPSVFDSIFQNFEFAGDPLLQIHSGGNENLYVAQQNGIIYSLKAGRHPAVYEDDFVEHGHHKGKNGRFLWATHVLQGSGIGGLAADKKYVYFTLINYFEFPWVHDDTYDEVFCGGTGALKTHDGLPGWYAPHPLCEDFRYDVFWETVRPKFFSPPALTNDILLVTSSDLPSLDWDCFVDENGDPCDEPCDCECRTTNSTNYGGHVFSISTHDGKTLSSYQTGANFHYQGISLHDRCAYSGNGYIVSFGSKIGNLLYGWCVSSPIVRDCDS
jgi:hypothetical protein